MKHLGDITKIDWFAVEPVDVVTGGSPCQDLSVAGKRAGLAGERSGLYKEQIRCVKELRQADVQRGRTGQFIRPRFMVWENVPGAFSSGSPKGADFAAVIEKLIKIAEPDAGVRVLPPSNGWSKSGCYYDYDGRWSIAWRVHDAQFWGVPQRRKRISLVADFGGLSAPEVLFERKGLSGHFEPSGTQGQGTAGAVESGAGGAISFQERAGKPGGCKGILIQPERTGALSTLNNQSVLRTEPVILESNQNHATVQTDGICTTLPAAMGMGGGYVPMVAVKAGQSMAGGIGYQEEVAPTLSSQMSGTEPTVYDARGNGEGKICPTITGDHKDATDLVCAVDCRNGYENEELSATIQAKENGGQSLNYINPVRCNRVVRRLTPLECERLQGCPDGWTDIGEWVDGKGKRHKEADSPRYKALGNSIALPFWKVLAKRISAQYDRDVTMGSLFDGIGGFPLVFEQVNGKGTARWASEIEEFPIAVTKLRFGDD